ncbi:putative ankyrin repeat protein [Zalerion maritima]|uniref:Ankyrin repeat protein n=1 Tax=Zalerion maritima TaxID=339359 RepID=A0AAD5S5P2_9PEZI|nr:putative ankyrin repeat protein [Zalerion maritima]
MPDLYVQCERRYNECQAHIKTDRGGRSNLANAPGALLPAKPEISNPVYDKDEHDDHQALLYISATTGCLSHVKEYLGKGANPKLADPRGRTPLEAAARHGHKELVPLFLALGCYPDPRDCWGQTPLWWAARNNHEDIVRLLLDKGADANSRDTRGRRVEHWPAQLGREGVLQILSVASLGFNTRTLQE